MQSRKGRVRLQGNLKKAASPATDGFRQVQLNVLSVTYAQGLLFFTPHSEANASHAK